MIAVVEFNYIGARDIVKMVGEATLISPYEETDMAPFNGIILSGSTGNPMKSIESKSLFTEIIMAKVPILGICYGMQVIAELYGGLVKDAPKEKGWVVADLFSDKLFDGYYPRERIMMSHRMSVVRLPLRFRTIAMTAKTPIAAIKHQSLPIYGIMWHPEKMTKRGPTLFKNFERMCQVEHIL